MSKKNAIILILTVVVGALAALIWFYFTSNNVSNRPPITTTSDVNSYDPFGTKASDSQNQNSNGTVSPITNDNQNNQQIATASKLRQISTDPISGASVQTDKDKKVTAHYILRASGHIYESYTDSTETKRLSNTTVPKVYESIWLPGGQKLVIRYLKENLEEIITFSVKINPATTTTNEFEGGIDGNFLPENINSLAVNPAGDKIFYLMTNLNGASGVVSTPTGLAKKLIFESPLVEWNVSWPKEESITITTKPAATVPGYMYFLNSQTGSLTKIIGGINGLTTKTNPTATDVLYSDSARNLPRLYLLNIKKGESKLLPWNTLPEKCVWSNTDSKVIYCAVPKALESGDYPDIWYKGLTSFSDSLWRLNTDTGASTMMIDLENESRQAIDVVDLQIDKNDNYLFFTNKTDLTFWSLGLK